MKLVTVFYSILIIIHHELGLNRPVKASSNSLFKSLPRSSSSFWNYELTHHCAFNLLHSDIWKVTHSNWSCSNSVSTVTRLWAGQLRNSSLIPGTDKEVFYYLKCPDWLWCPPSLLFNRSLDGGECKADHSSPPRAEIRNEWIHTPLLHGMQKDNFTSTQSWP
jgi:hypothetical protein